MFDDENDTLERIGAIEYDDFFKDYLLKNRLCVISSELTKKWRSRLEWVSDGRPNYDFLEECFGTALVPVANCSKRYFSSQAKEDMTFSEFIAYLKEKETKHQSSQDCLYLKDWHFCKAFPDYDAYDVPLYFKSDWLNEYWDQCSNVSDDYRFVYFGPKGSWTPFHADVFRSYSWSANICGCKKWIIYPPGQEDYLRDTLGNLIYDVTSTEAMDENKYPKVKQAQNPIVVVQREGEVIFVPSGWHHQVHNLENTISINHNWTNACGVLRMWEHLQHELKQVKQSIQDCKDMENWHSHCQVMLKALSGMDYKDFIAFLTTIARPRLDFLKYPTRPLQGTVFDEWMKAVRQQCSVKYYCKYDLDMIRSCAQMIKCNEAFCELNDQSLNSQLENILTEITSNLSLVSTKTDID